MRAFWNHEATSDLHPKSLTFWPHLITERQNPKNAISIITADHLCALNEVLEIPLLLRSARSPAQSGLIADES